MQSPIRHAIVVLRIAQVELRHGGKKARRATWAVQQDRELLRQVGVLAGRGGNHVEDTLPDFVEAIEARLSPTLQEAFEAGRSGVED